MSGPFIRRGADLVVAVRLTPKSSREAVEGVSVRSDGRRVLSCRVRAVPEDGRANGALEALLAKVAGLPRSAVRIESGHTARLKTVVLAGAPPEAEDRLLAGGATGSVRRPQA